MCLLNILLPVKFYDASDFSSKWQKEAIELTQQCNLTLKLILPPLLPSASSSFSCCPVRKKYFLRAMKMTANGMAAMKM